MGGTLRFYLLAALVLGLAWSAAQTTAQAPVGPGATPSAAAPAVPAEPEKPAKRQPGFLEILFSGGPIGVAIMLVLIGLSLTAAYLIFEQAMTLRESEVMPPELAEEVRDLVAAGKIADAQALCRKQPSFLAFVLLQGIEELEGGWAAVEKALEDALAEQAARLMRQIEYLAVIGNIAPMVGLLGTVTGMLLSFQTVATTEGKANAEQLATGIYQALVTTVVGLIIAIPALGAFAIFRNRADEFVAQVAYLAQHVFGQLKRGVLPPPPPPAPGQHAAPPPPPKGAR